VAGAVADPNVIDFAQKKGFYVIVQSGVAVEIVPAPENFRAKEW
jgi:hydrogenase maturation factor